MNRDIQRQTEQLNKKRLLRQRWHRWFSIPACAVVFVTAYALILPAITLDTAPDTYCGQEEHIHTDECYEIPGVPEHTIIDCPVQQELHIHTAACYGEDGALLCTEDSPQIIHHHDSFCFDSSGELLCTLPEVSEEDVPGGMVHQHTADCLTTVPAVAPEGLLCTKPEHIHTADCLDPEKWDVTAVDGEEDCGDDPYLIGRDTSLIPLTEMTGAELFALTDEELVARTQEFLSLTDEEFEGLNQRMAALVWDMAPAENVAQTEAEMLRTAPKRAPATAAIDPATATLKLQDNIAVNGHYDLSLNGGDAQAGGQVSYRWYRTKDNGTREAVARSFYRNADGTTSSNLGPSGSYLYLALDGGGVTIVLSIGVTNMSRRSAVIRRLTAVETLGCAQVICSDKTGTLTQNRMTVTASAGSDEHLLATAMALCADAVHDPDTDTVTGEPTEAALVRWAVAQGLSPSVLRAQYPRVAEAPFDSERKMMSTLHTDGSSVVQYTKGAPDVLLPLCDRIWIDGRAEPMTDAHRAEIAARNRDMTGRALRVLAAGMRTYDALPGDTSPAAIEQHLCFLGLAGMIDPVRPEVVDAIRACRSAGIRPIMITGDHVDTATAIAKELGLLAPGDEAVTGTELSAMDDDTFRRRLQHISVYARVQPEHKTRIVKAWRDAGFVTAMTGDGVNDAPSIRAADIGIGMGITGTDVTKNVADMVLADDNFATIVGAVEEGRRIYDNIQRAIKFLLGSNMSEVLSIFTATMLGFMILEPVHLLWINLLTDCFPALALGMERAEPDVMSRPPRSARESIFAHGVGFDCVYQGVMCAILTLAAFFIGHYMEYGVWTLTNSPDGTTMAFLTLSMAEIFHSFNMRAHRASIFTICTPNWALIGAAAASLALTTLCIYVPFLADAFDFTAISAAEYAVAMGLAVLVIPVVELVKCVQRAVEKRAAHA